MQQPVAISPAVPTADKTLQVAISKKSCEKIDLLFKNRYSFLDLSHLAWTWTLISYRDTKPLASGTIELGSTLEHDSAIISLDGSVGKIWNLERTKTSQLGNSYFLNIHGALLRATSWAERGHILVTEQIPLEFHFDSECSQTEEGGTDDTPEQQTPLSVSQDDSRIVVSRQVGNDMIPYVEICKKTGTIVSISPKGENVLASTQSLIPHYTRAATDNDRGGSERLISFLYPGSSLDKLWLMLHGYSTFSYQFRWSMAGLDPSNPPRAECDKIGIQDSSNDDEEITIIEAKVHIRRNDHAKTELICQTLTYRLYSDGRINISTHVIPRPALKNCQTLPRVGMSLAVDKSLYHIQYYGRGPVENYEDRKAAARMGVYDITPKDLAYHYIFPSENGNRSDCEWVALRSTNGEGICFATGTSGQDTDSKVSPFHFSAQLHNTKELHEATHTCDLEHRENGEHPIFINLDHKLMGVGGDVSWMPCVYDDYLVKSDQEFQYDFWILPLADGDDPALAARTTNEPSRRRSSKYRKKTLMMNMLTLILLLLAAPGAVMSQYSDDDYVNEVLEEDYRNDADYENPYMTDDDEARLNQQRDTAEENRKAEEMRRAKEAADRIQREREAQFEEELSRMSEEKQKAAKVLKRKDAKIVKQVLKASKHGDHYGVLGLRNMKLAIPPRTISLGTKIQFTIPGFELFAIHANHIKRAYRSRAVAVHPDKNRDGRANEAFYAVENAASVLSDEKTRQEYDEAVRRRRLQQRQMVSGKAGYVTGLVLRSMRKGFAVFRSVLGPFAFPVLILGSLIA